MKVDGLYNTLWVLTFTKVYCLVKWTMSSNQGQVGTMGGSLPGYWMNSISTSETLKNEYEWNTISDLGVREREEWCWKSDWLFFLHTFSGVGSLTYRVWVDCLPTVRRSICYSQKVTGENFKVLSQRPLQPCPQESLRWIEQYDVLAAGNSVLPRPLAAQIRLSGTQHTV